MVTSVNSSDYLSRLQNPTSTSAQQKTLGQSEFLQLLIAQMKNQDPLKPMENGEFMAELAQFNSLTELQNLNNSFASFQSAMLGTQLNQASTLVGKTVMSEGDLVSYSGSGTQNLAVDLGEYTDTLELSVYNSSGALVGTQTYTGLDSGVQSLSWNGLNADGEQQPPGQYIVVANSITEGGYSPIQLLTPSRVVSVNLSSAGEMQLNLANGGQTSFDAIRQIAE
jgi:flagellar basal-body rod modification protein FlgD